MSHDADMNPAPPPRRGRDESAAVTRQFDAHARAYDRMTRLNPGYHDHLRMSARRMGLPGRGAGLHLLDLGCGTGSSTAALLDAAPEARITAVDASAEMLARAQDKTWPAGVKFVQADAMELNQAGLEGPFDGILAAYLLRNVPDPHRSTVLRHIRGLLAPGAPLALHEYSVADSARARARWNAVCWMVIIPLGRITDGSTDIYGYLRRSVNEFDGAEALVERMVSVGYTDVREQTFNGWQQHILHTFLGRAPGVPLTPGADPDAPTPPEGIDLRK